MAEDTHHWACRLLTHDDDCDCYLSDRAKKRAEQQVIAAIRPIARRLFYDVALMQPEEQTEVMALCDALADLDALTPDKKR